MVFCSLSAAFLGGPRFMRLDLTCGLFDVSLNARCSRNKVGHRQSNIRHAMRAAGLAKLTSSFQMICQTKRCISRLEKAKLKSFMRVLLAQQASWLCAFMLLIPKIVPYSPDRQCINGDLQNFTMPEFQ
jgi:hypothetical protein